MLVPYSPMMHSTGPYEFLCNASWCCFLAGVCCTALHISLPATPKVQHVLQWGLQLGVKWFNCESLKLFDKSINLFLASGTDTIEGHGLKCSYEKLPEIDASTADAIVVVILYTLTDGITTLYFNKQCSPCWLTIQEKLCPCGNFLFWRMASKVKHHERSQLNHSNVIMGHPSQQARQHFNNLFMFPFVCKGLRKTCT